MCVDFTARQDIHEILVACVWVSLSPNYATVVSIVTVEPYLHQYHYSSSPQTRPSCSAPLTRPRFSPRYTIIMSHRSIVAAGLGLPSEVVSS